MLQETPQGNIFRLPSKTQSLLKVGEVYKLFHHGDPLTFLSIILTGIKGKDAWGKKVLESGETKPIFFNFCLQSFSSLGKVDEKEKSKILKRVVLWKMKR